MRQFIALVFLLISMNIYSQERNYTIDTIQVKSEILKENRSMIVYKSLNISKADSVNFLYLIDGEYSDYRFQRIKERFKDSISNLMAVGIVNTDRRRDLLYIKSADKFLCIVSRR
jgi:enterochelin esterase-like enzyme